MFIKVAVVVCERQGESHGDASVEALSAAGRVDLGTAHAKMPCVCFLPMLQQEVGLADVERELHNKPHLLVQPEISHCQMPAPADNPDIASGGGVA